VLDMLAVQVTVTAWHMCPLCRGKRKLRGGETASDATAVSAADSYPRSMSSAGGPRTPTTRFDTAGPSASRESSPAMPDGRAVVPDPSGRRTPFCGVRDRCVAEHSVLSCTISPGHTRACDGGATLERRCRAPQQRPRRGRGPVVHSGESFWDITVSFTSARAVDRARWHRLEDRHSAQILCRSPHRSNLVWLASTSARASTAPTPGNLTGPMGTRVCQHCWCRTLRTCPG
jgi:hypothetical protein